MDPSLDPALWELYESGAPDDEVSVILRLIPGAEPPPNVRVVSRFGDIVTARIRRGEIVSTRQSPGVFSLKASTIVTLPPLLDAPDEFDADVQAWAEPDESSAPDATLPQLSEDGRGVVVGVCDWGFDFTHPNFRNADGSTRLQCLWDQRGVADPLAPSPYNYGRLLAREAIDAALADPDPFTALGYHPASGDPTNTGSHGTHVVDILAGNRREPGSVVGLASASDIVCVHLAAPQLGELDSLGDSVGLLEGLDFIRRQAAGRPCVLHLSAGKTGGPHRGNTLLERAVDAMLQEPGIVLVQSVGNYAHTAMHTLARVGPDQKHTLNWITPTNDRTPNELEIWYSGEDVFEITLVAPDGRRNFSVPLGNRMRITDGTNVWGNFYHRLHEPNSGMNHINIHLHTGAPSGQWKVVLHGRDIVDGRLQAWIERDATGRYQSRFPQSQASSRFTTNTICNCFRAIAVGAYDGTQHHRPPTVFSSRGPTADGRQKPELAAPGYRIRAARSTPRDGWRGEPRLTVKSGTSMAAPWVSGTVALMLSAAGRPLTIHEVRRALIGTADPHPGPSGRTSTQLGYGYLNIAAAVAAARRIGAMEKDRRSPAVPPMEEDDSQETAWAPIWAEDAAAGAHIDQEAFSEPQIDEGEPASALEATDQECGCGHRDESVQQESAGEQPSGLEDLADEDESLGAFEADAEEIATSFVLEDVREALDAFAESEA